MVHLFNHHIYEHETTYHRHTLEKKKRNISNINRRKKGTRLVRVPENSVDAGTNADVTAKICARLPQLHYKSVEICYARHADGFVIWKYVPRRDGISIPR